MRQGCRTVLLPWRILFILIPCTILSHALFAVDAGDVTGDGLIDGRDALRIMRFVNGHETLSDDEKARADVSPAPGTDGRLIGNGVIDNEDALRILYQSVGLIPMGELTGDYSESAPIIEDFTPRCGPVGTQVTIKGRNFVAAWMNENAVWFGDASAQIHQITGTKIVTLVPDDAASGRIFLKTPGGTAESPFPFTVTTPVKGRLDLGAGLHVEDFTVVSVYGETDADPDTGEFTLLMPRDAVCLVGAVPKGAGENSFLAMLVPGGETAGGRQSLREEDPIVVDAVSTAMTLVFMHPFLISRKTLSAQTLIGVMENLPEVNSLAGVIARKYPQGAPGLDDSEVEAAWQQAVIAVMNALPSGLTFDIVTPPGTVRDLVSPGSMSQPMVSLYPAVEDGDPAVKIMGIDLDYLQFKYKPLDHTIKPSRSMNYSPVDWIVALYRLDPADMPRGLSESFADLKKRNIRRLEYERSTMVPSNLWTARIDILRYSMFYLMNTIISWTGISLESGLPLEDKTDGIYMIRGFSGSYKDRWHFSGDDGIAMKAFQGDPKLANTSTGVNIVLALVDVWALVAGKEGTPHQDALKGGLRKAYMALDMQIGATPLGVLSDREALDIIVKIIIEAGKEIAFVYEKEGLTQAQKKLQGTFEAVLEKSLPLLKILSKISLIGKVGERIVGLMGYLVNPLGLSIDYGPTPLETALVLVGDPFSPVIDSLTPDKGSAGTEVTLHGKRFALKATDNIVKFENLIACVKSVNAGGNELVVQVPEGLSETGEPLFTSVETPASLKPGIISAFIYRDIPVITDVSPGSGFAASSNPSGKPWFGFQGTQVEIRGYNLNNPSYHGRPNHKIYFGFTEAAILYQTANLIRVKVPAMESSGPHSLYIVYATDEGTEETPHRSFHVYGPPVITNITPSIISAGGLLDITGSNLYSTYVYVGSSWGSPMEGESGTHIFYTMPSGVGKPGDPVNIEVWNPAGSASREVTLAPGIQVPDLIPLLPGLRFTIDSTDVGLEKDGMVTLDEAMSVSRGTLNFWKDGYDDTNWEYKHHWYEVETAPDEYTWVEHLNELEKKDLQTNGAGTESITHYKINHDRYGGVSAPIYDRKENLDDGSDTSHMPEEGDKVTILGTLPGIGTFNGANYMDEIKTSTAEQTIYAGNGILMGPQDRIEFLNTTVVVTSGDIILKEGNELRLKALQTSSPVQCTQNHIKIGRMNLTDQMTITGAGIVVSGAFKVFIYPTLIQNSNGHGIRLDHSGSCQIEVAVQTCAGDGWRLEGSNQNRIGGGVSGCGARGYYIADSHNNGIGGFAAANCTGIGLLMEQCLNNEVMGTAISQCAEGIRLTDCENCKFTYGLEIADCQGNGVTISGGQANNLNGYGWITPVNILRCKANGLEVVNSPFNRFENMNSAGNTKNGIVLHGDNSSYNTFRTINSGLYHNPDGSKDIILLGNGENGVYLYDGACHNSFIIDYYPNNFSCNSLNGVLLEGEKTQYNQFTGNIGFFTQSYWNVYPVGNGGDGIRFTGGASHNQILNSQIHFNSGNGILLEGTGTSYNVVSNTSVGTILVEGGENPGSRANKGLGIYITDPACYNTFTGVKVGVHDLGGVYCGQLTALPENGLSNVVFDNCDIGWVDTIQMNSKGNTAAGNAVQADACGLELSGCSHTRMNAVRIKNYHTGLYIAGGDPTGHYLDIRSEDCTGDGISIDGLHDQSIYRLNAFNCGSNGIVLKNAVNIEFEESNAHYSFMNGGHGLLLENCRNLRLPGLPLTQNTGDGLRVRNSSEVIFVDVNLSDNGGNGAAILANSSFVSIHDGMIDNNGGYGVCMQESTDLQVCPLTSDEHMGIGDNGAGCALVQDAGNIFIGSGIQDRPLYLSTDLGAAVTITGPGTDNVRVSGCSFSSNGPDVAQGILISGGDNILIGNRNPLFFNNINLGAGAGIQAQGNVHNLQILNNIIGTDPSFNHAFGSFPNQIGILFQNGLTGAITADNTIIMNSSHGVLVRDGANANIFSDNEIVMNGGDGIRIEGIASNHNLITCNRIFNNAGKGIALDGGNDNIAAPVITNISESSSAISGVINPVPPAGTLVEVYSDRDDEGESLLGIAPVLGNNFCVNATIPVARLFHAVAVHPEGNTSEFGTAIPYGKADWYSFLFTDEFLSRRQVHIQKAGLPIPTGLTPEGVNEWDVQAGADGEGLVFVSDAEGNPDIRLRSFLLNKTFSLTSNSFPDYSPSWLNGQNRLAFVSERDGNPEIYTLDFMPDLPLGEIPASEGDMEDAVSRETGDGFGARFDSAPGKIRQLHFYIADEPACFEWRVMTIGAGDKPDSIAASGDTTPTVTGWHVVDIAPIAAPHPFAVCIIFRNDRQPFIGLAERSLSGAYYSLSSGSWYSSIASYYMIRAVVEPESPARITDNGAPDLFPDWSPDGSTIAFASSRSGTMDVWLMDFDGMNPRKITDGTGLNTKPVWSPDGTLIAFVSNRSGNNDIYTIKPDGTGLSQVTNDSADDTDPVWAPDGEILLFSSNRSGDHEIYGQRIVSGAVQRLTWRSGGATEPEVTTDVFLRNSGLGSAEGGLLQNGAEEYMTHDADVSSTLAISLSSTKAMPGDSVEMTLEISDAQNLGNLAFEIAYDPTVLQITSNPQVVINGSTIGAIYPDIYPDDFGIVQFNCVHPEGYNSGGVLLRLSVKIKPSVQDARTILALENKSAYAVDLTPLHTQSQDGVITFYLFTGTGWVTY